MSAVKEVTVGQEHLVNFVTLDKVGRGPYHNKLMATEYSEYLSKLKTLTCPAVFSREQVVTVFYKPKDGKRASLLDLKESFVALANFCVKEEINHISIPAYIWVREGFAADFIGMVIVKAFKNRNIKVKMI